jgi:hypothetical protein
VQRREVDVARAAERAVIHALQCADRARRVREIDSQFPAVQQQRHDEREEEKTHPDSMRLRPPRLQARIAPPHHSAPGFFHRSPRDDDGDMVRRRFELVHAEQAAPAAAQDKRAFAFQARELRLPDHADKGGPAAELHPRKLHRDHYALAVVTQHRFDIELRAEIARLERGGRRPCAHEMRFFFRRGDGFGSLMGGVILEGGFRAGIRGRILGRIEFGRKAKLVRR